MSVDNGLQGLWWQPTAGSMKAQPGALAASAAAEGEGGAELLRLAAAQRMSTEARRAVFCVVMGAQDAGDACERLLRLPLKVCSYLLNSSPLSKSMSTEAHRVVFCFVIGRRPRRSRRLRAPAMPGPQDMCSYFNYLAAKCQALVSI